MFYLTGILACALCGEIGTVFVHGVLIQCFVLRQCFTFVSDAAVDSCRMTGVSTTSRTSGPS